MKKKTVPRNTGGKKKVSPRGPTFGRDGGGKPDFRGRPVQRASGKKQPVAAEHPARKSDLRHERPGPGTPPVKRRPPRERPGEKPGRPVKLPGGELVWGINPVSDLLRWTPERIRQVWLAPRSTGRLRELREKLAAAGVKIREAWPERLDGMTGGGNHQGVAAEADEHAYAEFEALISRPGPCSVFLLDGVTDVGNLANLLRSLLAFAVDLVVLPRDRSAGITPTVHHLSAGASLRLPVARVTNLVRAMEELKEQGFTVVGTAGDGETDVRSAALPERVAVVLGSEGKGMRPLVARQCDRRLRIPLPGGMESLNVSVAGALIAWEIIRARAVSPLETTSPEDQTEE